MFFSFSFLECKADRRQFWEVNWNSVLLFKKYNAFITILENFIHAYNAFWSLWFIHPTTPGFSLLLPPYTTWCPLTFKYFTEFNLCCPYMHGCGSIHWSMVHLPEDITLKKTEFTSPGSHQLSRAPQPRVGVHETLPYYVVDLLDLVWLLCRQPELLWFHESNDPFMPKRHHYYQVLPNLWLLQYFCSFSCDIPQALWESMWYRCAMLLHRYLFSERQPHVRHFFVRTPSSTNLRVKGCLFKSLEKHICLWNDSDNTRIYYSGFYNLVAEVEDKKPLGNLWTSLSWVQGLTFCSEK